MKFDFEIVKFDVTDIITTSTPDGLINGGEGGSTGTIVIPKPASEIDINS